MPLVPDLSVRPARRPMPRRRFLHIAAGVAGAVAFSRPGSLLAAPSFVHWQGRVMGADARLTLYGLAESQARPVIDRVLAEVRRLEGIFSLHRADSGLSSLNSHGYLTQPAPDMIQILETSHQIHRRTNGLFDPTVQPLWVLYADHFAKTSPDPDGPDAHSIKEAQSLVGINHVHVTNTEVRLEKTGMAITLNGIAQGYITDRVRNVLEAEGLHHVLVNMGEFAAIGPRPDGRHWTLGIADPLRPWHMADHVSLGAGGALATSAGAGSPFDASLRFHHLFDPHKGRSADCHRSVSVKAPTATLADGLSTAFSALPYDGIMKALPSFPGCAVLVIGHDGVIRRSDSWA